MMNLPTEVMWEYIPGKKIIIIIVIGTMFYKQIFNLNEEHDLGH